MSIDICYNAHMATIEKEPLLLEKRKEIMWSLTSQGYNNAEIGRIFGISRSRANVIMGQMPKRYKSPWVKV